MPATQEGSGHWGECKYPTETLSKPEITGLTKIAINAALASGNIVNRVFKGDLSSLQIQWKADATPRTIADIEGDIVIVNTIRQFRPQDDIFIEESGYHRGVVDVDRKTGAKFRWYADSLDGTRPFTEKKPESTVGVVVCDEKDNYVAAAIVHPGRKQIAFAMKNMGAWMGNIQEIDGKFKLEGRPQRLEVSKKISLIGATICVDSLFTASNRKRKHEFMSILEQLSEDDQGRITVSYDMTGSNIAYQLDVARGGSILGLTDAKGGDWDWRVGYALISEAGGVMIDLVTGEKPTNKSEVIIYGNSTIVWQTFEAARILYEGYQGFSK